MSKSDVQNSGKPWILEKPAVHGYFTGRHLKMYWAIWHLHQMPCRPWRGNVSFYSKAAPRNCVCESQPSFCSTSAVPKMGNTYSIPPFSELWIGTKILPETSCRIVRCCLKIFFKDFNWSSVWEGLAALCTLSVFASLRHLSQRERQGALTVFCSQQKKHIL